MRTFRLNWLCCWKISFQIHVDRVGLGSQTDHEIWLYARANDFILVSKDSDFYDKNLLQGYPPKVIWIKRGNCTNRQIHLLLRNKREVIEQFYHDDEIGFLIIF